MSTDDTDDVLPGSPNDEAYEKQEVRSGPPLDYVAEKFRHCLEGLHGAIRDIGRGPQTDPATTDAGQDDLIGFQAKYAFHSAVVGYLALHNMLALGATLTVHTSRTTVLASLPTPLPVNLLRRSGTEAVVRATQAVLSSGLKPTWPSAFSSMVMRARLRYPIWPRSF